MQVNFSNKNQLITIGAIILLGLLYLYLTPKENIHLLKNTILSENTHKKISGQATVIDGDSIIISDYEIRILHIDAPEYSQTCRNSNNIEYQCGIEAKKFLEEQLANHPTICKISGKDIYNRYLANCHNNHHDVSELMIRNGWALIYQQPSLYFSDQEYARLNKLGIWQGEFLVPKTYRKLNPRQN